MRVIKAEILENEEEYIIEVTYENGTTDEAVRVLKRLDGANYYINEFCNYICLVNKLLR